MSSEILVTFRDGLSLDERSLVRTTKMPGWGFSADYVDRLRTALLRFRCIGSALRNKAAFYWSPNTCADGICVVRMTVNDADSVLMEWAAYVFGNYSYHSPAIGAPMGAALVHTGITGVLQRHTNFPD